MDEFVRILYSGPARAVQVDGTDTAQTDQLFIVQTGHHRFTLGGADDYFPPFVEMVVEGTTIPVPLEITFAQHQAAAMLAIVARVDAAPLPEATAADPEIAGE